MLPHGTALVGATGIALALLGLLAATRIPNVPAADPSLRISPNLVGETVRVVRHAASIRPIWLSILGLSWFWTIGATLMTEFPVIARDTLHAGGSVLTLLLTVFAVGVGVGSVQCARLLHGEVSARLVPFAALGISLFCWDFATAATAAGHAGGFTDAAGALQSFAGWRMTIDLALLAMCGGMFSVPLYAIIQDCAAAFERSRMVAANNIMNALCMVAGSAAAATLAAAGLAAPAVLHLAAIANLAVAIWIVRILPHDVYRALLRWYFDRFHRVQVSGLENYRAATGNVVIVANHQSYLDAPLIAAYLPDSPTFAIHTAQAAKWYFKPFLAAVRTFPLNVQSPYAVKRMVEAVRDHGSKLMIFPEGRMTHTGALMKVYEGAALVADKSHAQIVPISIEGLQFSRLSRMRGRHRVRWFPRIKLVIGPPVTLAPADAEHLTPRQRREATGRALQDLMVAAALRASNTNRSLFTAILEARSRYGGQTLIAEDINRTPITYDRLILGAVALGRALTTAAAGDTHIALLLPNAVATLVSFIGLHAFGHIPCMLNASAGSANMLAACRAAGVTRVICSRTFIEKARLTAVAERLQAELQFIWLEDLRATIGLRAKLRAKRDTWRPSHLPGAATNPDAPAVVLFTSGSEGTPKGVVLSHRNLVANCAQVASVIDFHGGDIVFNAMPMFHAFGLTGGTILPLLYGVRTFHYPSPLHYRVVPALIYDTDATICFGTDTFLSGWARYAHPYDFYAMRYIFAGAEKLRDETRLLFSDRFGVRILQGYGATETSPVLALNTAMHSRPGTVGRLLPGIEHRLQPVPGVDTGGELWVRGPNVMLGYLRDSAPGVLERLTDGWYDTGDIVTLDDAGFVSIVGRVKRFAKIAGEMVSMTAAEALVAAAWPDASHAVISVPDARKGESLLLVTTRNNPDTHDLLSAARQRGVPEIMVPRATLAVRAIPLLATGKVDYPAVARLVEEHRADATPEAAIV
jgi:acyl-[acyl-carrier-protein]-phospholipid O-acyltransferase/long-chain-fatty-acid--[acyl-carrier-protein] ligase